MTNNGKHPQNPYHCAMGNFIFMIHLIFVLYVISLPFVSDSVPLLFLHIALLLCIIVHWLLNNDVCFLTWLEHKMYKDKPIKDLFMQRVVGPVYNVSNKEIKYGAYVLLLFTATKLILLTKQHGFSLKALLNNK